MQFFMEMIPPTVTAQEHKVSVRNGKPVFYDPPELTAARDKLTAHLAKHRPVKPLEGAVRLHVVWCFPAAGGHKDGEYRTSKPDTDNLNKLLKDCMTRTGYWHDDAQVVSETCEKYWAIISGILVSVESIPPLSPTGEEDK